MTRAAVFDVNETLLDLAALDPLFTEWLGGATARSEWFARTIHFALTLAATRSYRSFGEVGAAALGSVASERGVTLPFDAPSNLREAMLRLPPHADVEPALRTLRDAGIVTAALSNNPLAVVQQQLEHANVAALFDQALSVEQAGALKPAPEVYRHAIDRLALPSESIWMIAAHGWDIAGATRVGLRGAFVARRGQTPDPFAPPEIIGNDLAAVARAIVNAEPGDEAR